MRSYLTEETLANLLTSVANFFHRIDVNAWRRMINIALVGVIQCFPQEALFHVIEDKFSALHPRCKH
jgi:hypothetical protein